MKLVPQWRRVLRHAWTIRLLVAAGILSGFEVALPIIDQFASIPRGVFAALSGFTTCAAFIARFVAQENLKDSEDADK